jgi:hypothetical protein
MSHPRFTNAVVEWCTWPPTLAQPLLHVPSPGTASPTPRRPACVPLPAEARAKTSQASTGDRNARDGVPTQWAVEPEKVLQTALPATDPTTALESTPEVSSKASGRFKSAGGDQATRYRADPDNRPMAAISGIFSRVGWRPASRRLVLSTAHERDRQMDDSAVSRSPVRSSLCGAQLSLREDGAGDDPSRL